MKRLWILIVALLVGAAAPARAWCEATCLTPSHHGDSSAKPHCPTSEPAGAEAQIAAGNLDDCPIVEAARPTTFAKLDFALARLAVAAHAVAPGRCQAPRHLGTQAPRHLRHLSFIPLRV